MSRAFRSTSEIRTGRFQAHGRVDFHIEGRVLLTRAAGPFNAELVRAVQALVVEVFTDMARHPPWAQLVLFDGSALSSPDALEGFTRMMCALSTQGLAPHVSAHVLPPEVEGATLMTKPIRDCYAQAGLRYAHFLTEPEARAWLQAELG